MSGNRFFCLKILALTLLPLALLVVTTRVKRARGPYWLGTNSDPDYVYLLNGLALAQGERPTFVYHPGTPAIGLTAVTLRAAQTIRGSGGLAEDVLKDPEGYLEVVHLTLLTLAVATLFGAGVVILWATGNLVAATLIQLGPFFSMTLLVYTMPRVMPEALLATLSLAMASATIAFFKKKLGPGTFTVLSGVLGGLAAATKLTALPLVAIPLVILPAGRYRILLLVLTVVTFVGGTLPIIPMYPQLFQYVFDLATHSEAYGTGEKGWVSPGQMFGNMLSLAGSEKVFASLVALSLSAVLLGMVVPALRRFFRPRRELYRLLLAVTLADLAQVFSVAKTPDYYYAVPGLTLVGLNLVLIFEIIRHWESQPVQLVCLACGGVLLSAGAAWAYKDLKDNIAWARSSEDAQLEVCHEVTSAHAECELIYHYGASSIPSALWFGNFGVDETCRAGTGECTRFIKELQTIYPRVIFYDSTGPFWDTGRTRGVFWNWSKRVEFRDIAEGGRPVIFQGMAFCKYNCSPPDVELRLVYPAGLTVPDDTMDYPMPEVLYEALHR